jgi:hypothetical protein
MSCSSMDFDENQAGRVGWVRSRFSESVPFRKSRSDPGHPEPGPVLAVVIAEISMSLVLLVGAFLFVRSFLNLQQAATGVDKSPLMTLRSG